MVTNHFVLLVTEVHLGVCAFMCLFYCLYVSMVLLRKYSVNKLVGVLMCECQQVFLSAVAAGFLTVVIVPLLPL